MKHTGILDLILPSGAASSSSDPAQLSTPALLHWKRQICADKVDEEYRMRNILYRKDGFLVAHI